MYRRRKRSSYRSSMWHPSSYRYRPTYTQKKGMIIQQSPAGSSQVTPKKSEEDYKQEAQWYVDHHFVLYPPSDMMVYMPPVSLTSLFNPTSPDISYFITQSDFQDLLMFYFLNTGLLRKIPPNYTFSAFLLSWTTIISSTFDIRYPGVHVAYMNTDTVDKRLIMTYDTVPLFENRTSEYRPQSVNLLSQFLQASGSTVKLESYWYGASENNRWTHEEPIYTINELYQPISNVFGGVIPLLSTPDPKFEGFVHPYPKSKLACLFNFILPPEQQDNDVQVQLQVYIHFHPRE